MCRGCTLLVSESCPATSWTLDVTAARRAARPGQLKICKPSTRRLWAAWWLLLPLRVPPPPRRALRRLRRSALVSQVNLGAGETCTACWAARLFIGAFVHLLGNLFQMSRHLHVVELIDGPANALLHFSALLRGFKNDPADDLLYLDALPHVYKNGPVEDLLHFIAPQKEGSPNLQKFVTGFQGQVQVCQQVPRTRSQVRVPCIRRQEVRK